MKQYKYIIWDWNGTLLNDNDLSLQSINSVLGVRDMPLLTMQEYRDIFNFPVKRYYQDIGFDFKTESFEIVGTEFINLYNRNIKNANLNIDALHTLNVLKTKGVGQSVLSARKAIQLTEEIKIFKIHPFFDYMSGLDNHYAESKLENGKQLLNKIPIDRNQIILIGDTLHDAQVARELKIDCMLLTTGHQNERQLEQAKVPLISSLLQLLED